MMWWMLVQVIIPTALVVLVIGVTSEAIGRLLRTR